ncbi:hypothetical protein B0H15DRAFT_858668 [Mycena belliarum]|uniref:Uncharacterized protein n=1 Tax=Mycena belliarum TaxID=1033014 RepID=A0AAD6XHI0_9AGAR|nr:hypothetical protein B0H15DRAFT_858668 [Mycena belliae]
MMCIWAVSLRSHSPIPALQYPPCRARRVARASAARCASVARGRCHAAPHCSTSLPCRRCPRLSSLPPTPVPCGASSGLAVAPSRGGGVVPPRFVFWAHRGRAWSVLSPTPDVHACAEDGLRARVLQTPSPQLRARMGRRRARACRAGGQAVFFEGVEDARRALGGGRTARSSVSIPAHASRSQILSAEPGGQDLRDCALALRTHPCPCPRL